MERSRPMHAGESRLRAGEDSVPSGLAGAPSRGAESAPDSSSKALFPHEQAKSACGKRSGNLDGPILWREGVYDTFNYYFPLHSGESFKYFKAKFLTGFGGLAKFYIRFPPYN